MPPLKLLNWVTTSLASKIGRFAWVIYFHQPGTTYTYAVYICQDLYIITLSSKRLKQQFACYNNSSVLSDGTATPSFKL